LKYSSLLFESLGTFSAERPFDEWISYLSNKPSLLKGEHHPIWYVLEDDSEGGDKIEAMNQSPLTENKHQSLKRFKVV
jgi:hypothetical protein